MRLENGNDIAIASCMCIEAKNASWVFTSLYASLFAQLSKKKSRKQLKSVSSKTFLNFVNDATDEGACIAIILHNVEYLMNMTNGFADISLLAVLFELFEAVRMLLCHHVILQ